MSKVIKNFEGSRQSRDSRVFDMAELGEEAAEFVGSAREAAERVLSEAKAEAERLESEAYARGLDKGRAAVRGEVEVRIAEEIHSARSRETAGLITALRAAVSAVHEGRESLLQGSKDQLVALAIDIARSVVKREVRFASDVVKLNLEEAIRLSARRSKLLIHLNEMDMHTLETVLNGQPLLHGGRESVEVIPSADVPPGGCLVETVSGTVDARLETQLAEIEKALLGDEHHG